MIIPVASVCTDGYQLLRNVPRRSGSLAISSFNDRPGKLFDGLEHIRLSIILCDKSSRRARATDTTKYNRWLTVERPTLFERLALTDVTSVSVAGPITKIGTKVERQILDKVLSQARTLDFYAAGTGQHYLYYTRKLSGFVQILDFIPRIYDSNGELREPSELKRVSFSHEKTRDAFRLC